jgi:7-carboxy-7-deazaguanine synthase
VYVQPCDDQDEARNEANLKAAVESCMKFGYVLGVQMHKLADLK